jgi:hypothetical protein
MRKLYMFLNIGGITSEILLLIGSFGKRLVCAKLHICGTYNWIWVWII